MTRLTGLDFPRIAAWFAAAAFCLAGAMPAVAAKAIVLGGTSSGSRLLQALADEYRKTARDAEVVVADPSLGSSAGIRAVREGNLDLAVSTRPLQGDELDGELVAFEFARSPLVFAGRDNFERNGFTLGELEDIYAGRRKQWDNGTPIRLILRSRFASDTRVIRAMSPGLDKAVSLALQRKGMVVAASDLEALQIIEQTPGSLGPTTLGLMRLLNSDARVFSIAGRMPSARALADGSYPWFKTLYFVIPKHPAVGLQAFLNFLRSPQAADFLGRIEYLPAPHGK